MKNKRKILSAIILSLLLFIMPLNCNATQLLEEDEFGNEIINTNYEVEQDNYMNSVVGKKLVVDARNAIAIDGNTNKVLFDKKGDEVVPMASTTKILTALVAISQGDLDKEFEISKKAASIRGSTVGYSVGEKIKLRELLFGLMFKSGNDAAIAIAEGLGGSIEGFSKIMNEFAVSLGLTNSHFESPHGLDSKKHYSSAYDLAILTSTAMENEIFREICGEKSISKDKYNFTRDYSNINKILWKIPNANGVKTGSTGQAGKCLVSSVKYEGRNIIIVVLNCTDRWNQTDKIFNFVKSNYIFKDDKSSNESEKSGSLGTLIEQEDELNLFEL